MKKIAETMVTLTKFAVEHVSGFRQKNPNSDFAADQICCLCSQDDTSSEGRTVTDILVKNLGEEMTLKVFMIAKCDTNVDLNSCVKLNSVIKALCVLQVLGE
jgi:hypothetical protein